MLDFHVAVGIFAVALSVKTATVALLVARWCCGCHHGLFVLVLKEFFGYTNIHVVPRQSFVEVVGTNNLSNVNATIFKGLLVVFVVEFVTPGIKASAIFVCLVKRIGNSTSATSKHRFQKGAVVVVVGEVDTLFAQVFRKVTLFLFDAFPISKGAPLERCKWLWNKCGARYGNAQIFAALFDPFVKRFDFARQVVDTFHILHCFGWEAKHKVQLYRCVTLVESIRQSGHDVFFGDVFVDYVTQALCTCLGGECQTTFAVAHCHVAFEAIQTQAWQV